MTEDAEPAVINPLSPAPSGGEPASPKRSLSKRYVSSISKRFEGKTGQDKFGLVFAVSLYWIIGFWAFQTHSEIFRIFSAYGAAFLAIFYIARSGFWRRAWNYTKAYLWNAIDAIPVLQINETIHWAIPPLFGTKLGQASEILFRLLVLAPGLSVITRYLQYNGSPAS